MKTKTLMVALLGSMLLLTACGSGSKTVEVKDAKVAAGTSNPDYATIANAISAVPGQYEMTWAKSREYSEGFTQFNLTLKIRLEEKLTGEIVEKLNKDTMLSLLLKLDVLDIDGREFAPQYSTIVWSVGKTFGDRDEDLAKIKELLTNSEVGTVAEINFYCMPTKDSEREMVIEKTEQIQVRVGV